MSNEVEQQEKINEPQQTPQNKNKKTLYFFVKFIAALSLAIVCAFLINKYVFSTTRVHGESMRDTLYGGVSGYDESQVDSEGFFDFLFFGRGDQAFFGDKVLLLNTKNVEKGDIIVFNAVDKSGNAVYVTGADGTKSREQLIKRVIATGGDTVKIFEGKVYVNGELLNEPYILEKDSTYVVRNFVQLDTPYEITIGENEIFVMGDNRRNSTDSRVFGAVSIDEIAGKVVLVFQKEANKISTPDGLSGI